MEVHDRKIAHMAAQQRRAKMDRAYCICANLVPAGARISREEYAEKNKSIW
jgi:hypothetical protein